MDTESIKAITDGVVKVLTILGPALITAFVGYKVGKVQVDSKLKELEKQHAYSASEKLFDYYKDREKELSQAHTAIYENLGFLIGYASGGPLEKDQEEILKIYDMYKNVFPTQLRSTIRDMEKYNLQETEEYSRLKELINTLNENEEQKSLGDRVFGLMEKYENLRMGNHLILEKLSTGYLEIFTKT